MQLLTNHEHLMWLPRDNKTKKVLPKTPSYKQLRNFSKDPIVRKAISIVSDSVAALPYTIDVIDGKGKHLKQIRAIKNVIEHPNLHHSRKTFTKMLIDDAMVVDAMCAEVATCADPEHPIYMYPVDGTTIQMVVPRNFADLDAAAYMQQQHEGQKFFTVKQLAYLQRQYFTYHEYGLSPMMTAYQYIRYYLDASEMANERATNSTAEFLINLGENINEEQRKEFIEYMENEIEGSGHIPVIAGTNSFDTKQIKATGQSGLYLDWLDKLTQIIGVAFSIPPERLGLMVANDRSTGEDQENMIVQELIKPYAGMFEDLYNNYIIKPMGLEGVLRFKFVFEESEQQRTAKSTRLVDEYFKGCITQNEFRQFMGYEPSTDKYADMTYQEKTTAINVDYGIAGGFSGVGNIKDTTPDIKEAKTGGENDG